MPIDQCDLCGQERRDRVCLPCFERMLVDARQVRIRDLLAMLILVAGPERHRAARGALPAVLDLAHRLLDLEDAKLRGANT